MNTNIRSSRRIHPLVLAAAVCVMLFSLLGSAALMGWLPNSRSDEDAGKASLKTEQPAPQAAAKSAKRQRSQIALSSTRGVVESVREVVQKGEGSGVGALAGGVAGGVLGHQIGGGHGRDAMTVVGVLGGGLAGNEVEKRVRATKSYVIDVRFDDGSTRSFTRSELPPFQAGDRIHLVDGVLRSDA